MGMGSRPCLHGGRLCAGIHEGMGPRVREDTREGGGFPSLSSRGQALRRHSRGDVSPHPRGHGGGERLHPHPSLPPSRGKEKRGDGSPSLSSRGQALRRHSRGDGSTRPRGHKGGGWVPIPVFTRSGSAPAFTRGWVHASARTRVGMDSPSLSSRGQALRRHSRGDGSTRPLGQEWGWIPIPVFTGVRLCAGIHEGMGPRVREDTREGGGFPSLSSRGQALRRHSRGDGSTRPRGQEWGGFPSLSSRGSGSAPAFTRGWVPASARTRGGRLHPYPSLPPKGEGKREGMGFRIREDKEGDAGG